MIEELPGEVDGVSCQSYSLRRLFRFTSFVSPFFLLFSYSLIALVSSGRGSSMFICRSPNNDSMFFSMVLGSRWSLFSGFVFLLLFGGFCCMIGLRGDVWFGGPAGI